MSDDKENNVIGLFGGDTTDYIPETIYTEENKLNPHEMMQNIIDGKEPIDDIIVIGMMDDGSVELFSNMTDSLRLIGTLEKVKGRLVG